MWADIVRTFSHQNVFCSSHRVDDWLVRSGQERGHPMDLAMFGALPGTGTRGRLA